MSLSSFHDDHDIANLCVVCEKSLADSTGRGMALMVFHPWVEKPCGFWLHEACQSSDEGDMCPCGAGRVRQGVYPGHFEGESSDEGDEAEEKAGKTISLHFDEWDEARDDAGSDVDSDFALISEKEEKEEKEEEESDSEED